ncbi:Uma2 family endonuclease [Streptomyces lydicus]|uniref:Uma2 family endonuclease n=1 Tax=Streptomyces lydicus TaxID=47763 RepID=UPI0005263FDF|nr:Uma2 family endonuclease [Streptomyces lydicus]MDC7339042.1 Uma2 family endonuclease [Streptomyces lydicus]UEG91456.1 Uma2 family endonuclease [Streptomyces lydicus]
MTAVDERRMTELFENLEVPEGIKIELLRGEIVMMAGPDLVHNRIVRSVALQVPSDRWEWLMTQDIDILSEHSEPVPDLVVLEHGAGPDSGRLLPSAAVTMLVEVVSRTSVQRDYLLKRSIYAAGRVPVYLIIDPVMGQCVLLTEPAGSGDEADYAVQRITKFGDPVPLPLLDVELATGEFGTLKGVRPHRLP